MHTPKTAKIINRQQENRLKWNTYYFPESSFFENKTLEEDF